MREVNKEAISSRTMIEPNQTRNTLENHNQNGNAWSYLNILSLQIFLRSESSKG